MRASADLASSGMSSMGTATICRDIFSMSSATKPVLLTLSPCTAREGVKLMLIWAFVVSPGCLLMPVIARPRVGRFVHGWYPLTPQAKANQTRPVKLRKRRVPMPGVIAQFAAAFRRASCRQPEGVFNCLRPLGPKERVQKKKAFSRPSCSRNKKDSADTER